MPLFVHYQEYRCLNVKWHSDDTHHRFTLKIVRKDTAFANYDLTLTLNNDCTQLNYALLSQPKLAYHFDFSIHDLGCDKATQLLSRYLEFRTNEEFVTVNGDIFSYVLMLADSGILDDFTNDPFTYRCLAKRVKHRQSIDTLVQCNRHTIILACIAEHMFNFHDELEATHKSFVQSATIAPAVYKWLQTQPLYSLDADSKFLESCMFECEAFNLLFQLPLKERNRLLSQVSGVEDLIALAEAAGRRKSNAYIIDAVPLIELLKLNQRSPSGLANYVEDIAAMVSMGGFQDFDNAAPRTANDLVILHDSLVENYTSDCFAHSREVKDAIEKNKPLPSLLLKGLSFVKPITSVTALIEEGQELNHCIGSARYIRKLLRGDYFALKVYGNQRATLLIKKEQAFYSLEEISGKANSPVSTQLIGDIQAEIDVLNMTPQLSRG